MDMCGKDLQKESGGIQMSELKAFSSERIYWAVEQVERVAGDIDELHLDDNQFYLKSDVDKAIADLEENHKMEVEQLLMEIAGLKKLVETADKLLKPKGGVTIKNVTFGGVELEGIKTHKNEEAK